MSTLTGTTAFMGDIEKMCSRLDIGLEIARKKIAFDLYAGVRERTPVDTGRARANWDITAGEPSKRMDMMPDLKKGEAIPAPPMPTDLHVDGNDSIYIINNLPYIEPLEHGHSGKAPAGMVEPTIAATTARIQTIINAP